MAERTDDRGYPLAPRKAGMGWFYEDAQGLQVYTGYGTAVKITWQRVEKALLNHQGVVAKRRRRRAHGQSGSADV